MEIPLLPFFQPKGVVIIGASTSPEKLGYGVVRNLIQSGYTGAIHLVAQKSGEVFGKQIHTSLQNIPDPVELAILIVPTQATPQTIEDCGKRGIKAAIIVSAGFREVGKEGAELEKKCVEVAQNYGVRLLGPNCIGAIDTHLPLDTTFLQPPMPEQGGIGFISHSGAFAAAIIDWARGQGFGFSRIVSLGNQADVNETDMLPMLASDDNTKVIVMYMESISNGRRFVQVAREVSKHKPIIALKVGRFEAGQKAAASHTGALAASDTAFDAAFAKAGVLRAETAEQMFDWARALENCPLPKGNRIGILTNAGGPGVIAADSLEHHGLVLAQLAGATLDALSAILPPAANTHNPVDMLASASPSHYAECLNILLQDEGVDGVMVILPPPPMFKAEEVARAVNEVIGKFEKPVVIALMGSTLVENASNEFQVARVPTYPFPERAASALAALSKRQKQLTKEHIENTKSQNKTSDASAVNPNDLMQDYNIPTAPIKLATNEAEAVAIANELGYPVVMKIASPDISHKSDVGGVMLNIQDDTALQSGYAQMMAKVSAAMPNAKIEGVQIQRQIAGGQEVIIGMVRDSQFGALMMFGSGGVEVEGLKDVAFCLGPLNQAEAEEMMRQTWVGKKLKGFRSIKPVDEEAVKDVLIKLSQLAAEHEEIEEVEINPLRVLVKGAVAVDVRIKFKGE
ncbi:MAG: acetate--CoA ligase family protein [Anaerolineales bacterium]|nr:acetate--CoA ligase family protein [Anaerolineales bacterium]MCB9144271.1 acetate--CoA ligase family protein [Anaerolineales bacterium]